jgi:hypothetical protein
MRHAHTACRLVLQGVCTGRCDWKLGRWVGAVCFQRYACSDLLAAVCLRQYASGGVAAVVRLQQVVLLTAVLEGPVLCCPA